jgi:hypothetical protein
MVGVISVWRLYVFYSRKVLLIFEVWFTSAIF